MSDRLDSAKLRDIAGKTQLHDISGKNDLLLHVCCGPCAQWPVKSLLEEGFTLTAFFSNPNIHPQFEQKRRRDNAAMLFSRHGIPFLEDGSYMEEKWLTRDWEDRYSSRCEMCYDIRMNNTAQEAKRLGFTAFSTTLLVSPYQNHEAIIAAASKAAASADVEFVYRDFRPGFREGQKMAKNDGMYRQKYCGCIFSLEESAFKEKIYKSFAGSEG